MNQQEQLDPELITEVQETESERYHQWQQTQQTAYLNTRIVELGVENLQLKKQIEELTASTAAKVGQPSEGES